MNENDEVVNVHFNNKIIKLHFKGFDDIIDIDQLTKIDYSNLYAELITISALMNRVGLLKAQADNAQAESRLERNIEMARIGASTRQNAKTSSEKTVGAINEAVILNPEYQRLQRARIRKGKEAAYLDSLYWAVKSKEKKLDRIGEKMNLTPQEFEKNLVEGVWNGILINASKKLIN